MTEQRCENCRFYLETATDRGFCRKQPPVMMESDPMPAGVGGGPMPTRSGFPRTYPNTWCGEWEDETGLSSGEILRAERDQEILRKAPDCGIVAVPTQLTYENTGIPGKLSDLMTKKQPNT